MDDSDPMYTFFPESLDSSSTSPKEILYEALNLTSSASQEEIRKSYRKLALKYHPDKHSSTNKTPKEKEELSKQFQKIGFAYTILSDEGRKKTYDSTGRTDERLAGIEEMGWEAYFESLYKRVDRKILDEDKERYQGSEDEKNDLISVYKSTKGSLPSILNYIPHSTYTDEDRLIDNINDLIKSKKLESNEKWEKSSCDSKAKEKRRKSGEKAEKEAEKVAKELGVFEEFFGNGEKGKRMSDNNDKKEGGKKKKSQDEPESEGLGSLIMKRQRERENGLNALEEKYRKIEEDRLAKKAKKGKGKGKKEEEVTEMPEISDADFEALQAKMFSKKDEGKNANIKTSKSKSKSK